MHRRPYPSDVSDEEGDFVAPYLSVLPQTAAQRRHDRREVFKAVRSIVRGGSAARLLDRRMQVGAELSGGHRRSSGRNR